MFEDVMASADHEVLVAAAVLLGSGKYSSREAVLAALALRALLRDELRRLEPRHATAAF